MQRLKIRIFNNTIALATMALIVTLGGCTSDSASPSPSSGKEDQYLICGGFAGLSCQGSMVCVDDPRDTCSPPSGADCSGVCIEPAQVTACGGFAGLSCAAGETCVDDPRDDCSPLGADCMGFCVKTSTEPEPSEKICAGFAGLACDKGDLCVDDPRDACSPPSGADCSGLCIDPAQATACGGFAGLSCATGETCVDDPRDDCSPLGADCMGLCVKTSSSTQPDPSPSSKICGGFAGIPCFQDQLCVDDPRDDCLDLGADCSGLCLDLSQAKACGGVAGLACATGETCVDDPRDECSPRDVDCMGLCILVAK